MSAAPRPIEPRSAIFVIAVLTALFSTFLLLGGGLEVAAVAMGFVPARVSGLVELAPAVPFLLTPLSATLVHGNFFHLAANLIMLLFFGTQVERVLGTGATITAYLAGAFAAAGAQWLAGPGDFSPMVGASGAISALFGIYALMAGRPRQISSSASVNRALHVAWLLAAWVIIQWMTGQIAGGEGIMLATAAHIGGFVAGLLLERPLLLWRYRRA